MQICKGSRLVEISSEICWERKPACFVGFLQKLSSRGVFHRSILLHITIFTRGCAGIL